MPLPVSPAEGSPAAAPPPPEWWLRAALLLLALQAAALVGLAAYLALRAAGGGIHNRALLVTAAAGAAGTALLLATARSGLAARRRWVRAPLFLVEFFAAVVSSGLVQGGQYGYAVAVGAPSVMVLVSSLAVARHDGAATVPRP